MKTWIRRSLSLCALIAACALVLPAQSFAGDRMRHTAGYTTAIEQGTGPVVESRQGVFVNPLQKLLNRPTQQLEQKELGLQQAGPGKNFINKRESIAAKFAGGKKGTTMLQKKTMTGAKKLAAGDAAPAWKAKLDPSLLKVDCTPVVGVGTITGRVTDEATGDPILDIYVTVYDRYGDSIDSVYTDDNGTYTFSNINAGSYKVRFDASAANYNYDQNYASEWYDNQPDYTSATRVTITAGETTSGINAALGAGGSIAGRVTDDNATAAPIYDIYVIIYDLDGNEIGFDYTDDNGTYSFRGLATGSYIVQFDASEANYIYAWNYAGEWYDNQPDFYSATPVPVTVGETTPGINAQLGAGGSITGTVTDNATGLPIQDIAVQFGDLDYNYLGETYTDADGYYTMSGFATGSYKVVFDPNGLSYEFEWYSNKADFFTADPVPVTAGAATSGIDASLAVQKDPGGITGTVTDNATGLPIQSIYIYVTNGSMSEGAYTDVNGVYTVSGLPAGAYQVQFQPNGRNYLGEWYDNATDQFSATPVAVEPGITTPGINAQLTPGASISGTVTDNATGLPIQSIYIYVTNGSGSWGAYTAVNGTYTVSGLPPGSYQVQFQPNGRNYLGEWYDNVTDQSSATPVAVTAGETTPGINAQLTPGGSITGRVTDETNGCPIPHITVYFYDLSYNSMGQTSTNDNGTYSVSGFAPGSYKVAFNTSDAADNGLNYVGEWYDDQPGFSSATPVDVTAGGLTSGINAQLAAGGIIAGRVTSEASGKPILYIEVYVHDLDGNEVGYGYTDDNGTYRVIGLATGSYKVEFDAYSANYDYGGNYLGEWYNNQPGFSSATAVGVTAGVVTPGINAQLAAGSGISGRVTSEATGAPIYSATVYLYDLDGNDLGEYWTDLNGGYSIKGLAAGSYKVQFDPMMINFYLGLNYAGEWYDDKTSLDTANPVILGAGETKTINAELATGGIITGLVTDTADSPIVGIPVEVVAFSADGSPAGVTLVDGSTGLYSLRGLPAGLSYKVLFYAFSGYALQWYDNQASFPAANPVPVTAGAKTPDINAKLVAATPGSISGTVTDASDNPLANINIFVYLTDNFLFNAADTGADGTYTVGGLVPGSYKVYFDPDGQDYLGEWYNNQTEAALASQVVVNSGAATLGIDAELAAGAVTTTTTSTGGGTTTTTTTGGGTTTTTTPGGGTTTTTVSGGTTPAPATTTTTTSGRKLCPAQQALDTEKSGVLALCYKFRDTRLARTEAGRALTALYYRHGGEISQILSARDGLKAESRRLLLSLAPNMFMSLFRNQELTLRQAQSERIVAFIKQLQKTASPGLQADLAGLLDGLADGSLQRKLGCKVQ